MTDKLEPCRAMVNGKICGAPAFENFFADGKFKCPNLDCDDDFAVTNAQWNTLQRDRLDAARWREIRKRLTSGRFMIEEADDFGGFVDIATDRLIERIDAAINRPPKGENEGT